MVCPSVGKPMPLDTFRRKVIQRGSANVPIGTHRGKDGGFFITLARRKDLGHKKNKLFSNFHTIQSGRPTSLVRQLNTWRILNNTQKSDGAAF